MKLLIFIALLTTSTLGFATATCPANSKTFKICKSTPIEGDSEIASALDSIAICNQGAKASLVLEKDGDSEGDIASVVERMGGSTYSITDGNVAMSLSLPTGTRKASTKARFTITFTKAKPVVSASSTFTCK